MDTKQLKTDIPDLAVIEELLSRPSRKRSKAEVDNALTIMKEWIVRASNELAELELVVGALGNALQEEHNLATRLTDDVNSLQTKLHKHRNSICFRIRKFFSKK